MAQPPPSPPEFLPALTSMRFFAAAMIVVHHTHIYFRHGGWLARELPLDQGVSFFFVLSGFILFYNNRHIDSLHQAKRFVCSRIARIWPLHVTTFGITLMFVPQPWGPAGPALAPALANLVLVQGWVPVPGYFFSFNAVSWSLSNELLFYIVFPALALSWRRTWPWKLTLCALSAMAMIWLTNSWRLPFYDGTETVSIDAMVYINPLARLFEFALGILAAHIWIANRDRLKQLSLAASTLLECCALLLVLFSMTTLRGEYAEAFARGYITPGELKWLGSTATAPCFAILLGMCASQQGLLSRWLGWRPLIVLGEISFSLYMIHQILCRSLMASGTLAGFGSSGVQYGVYWLLALGSSYALFHLIEQPCRRAMLRVMLEWPKLKVARAEAV